MLNAKELRGIAEKSRAYKEAQKDARARETVTGALEYIRERVPALLEEAASAGSCETRILLGCTGGMGGKGLVAEFIRSTGAEPDYYFWEYALRGLKSRERSAIVHPVWSSGIERLLRELEDAGFKVSCRPREKSGYATPEEMQREDLSPEALVTCELIVSW